MKINKTKRFQNGRFYYYIDYRQMEVNINEGINDSEPVWMLCHQETAKYIGLPDLFGTVTKFGTCEDTKDYYQQ